uniref:NADH-ubiquinone oxidoreductase subunit B14.7 n=1 Tax=Paramoeba aestuarina TaxID=180227 RepID=A0A7S4PDC9_9EUKA|mmetsp:Transcript_4246/g.6357  ORF Transcript_4246/g.6357 Transcript_4246/m.6357 type:complete len:209 (+) Transcript_4246:60-686(+)|eukprot:CAMPEP_0201520814 /NCGR_PEP_ID=MMETSP0161_2-20130828/12715_1 /ASSEMBLY_ACC=CAM_ASM_000251 /TAXON_ID=180227 /ORGANISM="Neoparamoeba aestuarina, Strain SoJaBio B1-5/56/2" /LENGTH=208 /DNA_ID=CAMNT_0047919301 /DNA_START=57 /DNA_END=683 /DNA_ORIENTATION=+
MAEDGKKSFHEWFDSMEILKGKKESQPRERTLNCPQGIALAALQGALAGGIYANLAQAWDSKPSDPYETKLNITKNLLQNTKGPMILFGSTFGIFYASKCFFADMRGQDDVMTTTLAAIPTGLFIGGYVKGNPRSAFLMAGAAAIGCTAFRFVDGFNDLDDHARKVRYHNNELLEEYRAENPSVGVPAGGYKTKEETEKILEKRGGIA